LEVRKMAGSKSRWVDDMVLEKTVSTTQDLNMAAFREAMTQIQQAPRRARNPANQDTVDILTYMSDGTNWYLAGEAAPHDPDSDSCKCKECWDD
jgi:hypothetical protein